MSKKQPKVHYGIEITKPWSREMYDHNDKVADLMKEQIKIQVDIAENNDDWDTLNELVTLCGGLKHREGDFTIGELWERCIEELDNVGNWWLNSEYLYFVKKGLVKDIELKFVGYDK